MNPIMSIIWNGTSATSRLLLYRRSLIDKQAFIAPGTTSGVKKGVTDIAGRRRHGRNLTLDELRGIVAPIAERYGILRMFLFGSRARGDYDEGSDYDFIILCPEGMGLIGLTNFRNELMDALNSPVDFAYEGFLNDGFNSLVGSDRVLVYSSE